MIQKYHKYWMIAFIIGCSTGCSSLSPADIYQETVNASITPAITLADRTASEDVNGFLPEHVWINTLTQVQCMEYEFCIVDGHIYMKKKGEKIWRLFLKTGLPFPATAKASKTFRTPERIVELSADADSLIAFSNEGYMYQCFLRKVTIEKPWRWKDVFGWPSKVPLKQNVLVSDKRGWCMGARRDQILWYEDIFGNQHHYGTMGLETFYFLSADGQHIRFTDSGLPADFSHSITGPERGTFIASNISASGSTIFLINESGEMYTRLIDFDTMGCDPMFFKYTYLREEQPYPGTDYRSNFSNWGLPAEDWRRQPMIPLSGNAAISRFITISQNGQGNFARELRVAGLSAEGNPGYYHKQLTDEEWQFTEAPLQFPQNAWLSETGTVPGRRGKSPEISYQGTLFKNEIAMPEITCSVSDFLMSEGYCTLVISCGKISRAIKLYPVEMWTYQTRFDPGFDGTPKQFFITPEFLPSFLDTPDGQFTSVLYDIFDGRDRELFCARAEAAENYLQIVFNSVDNKKTYRFFLSAEGTPKTSPEVVKGSSLYALPLLQQFDNPELMLDPEKTYSIRDLSDIKQKIDLNKTHRTLLQGEIDLYKKLSRKAIRSRWGYNAVDIFTTVTLLNHIDFPKIKTITMFGGDILNTNYENFQSMAESRGWIYSHLISLLDLRISAYERMISSYDAAGMYPKIDSRLRNSFRGYFDQISFPEELEGISITPSGKTVAARIMPVNEIPVYPGFLLSIGDDEPAYVLVEAEDIAELVAGRPVSRNTPEGMAEDPVKTPVHFRPVHNTAGEADSDFVKKLADSRGTLLWNGTELEIRVPRALSKEKVLFSGSR